MDTEKFTIDNIGSVRKITRYLSAVRARGYQRHGDVVTVLGKSGGG